MPIRQRVFGYSSVYSVLQLGTQSSGQVVSLYVDPAANNSGNFDGNGRELLVPQDFRFIAPTASNTSFKIPIKFDDGRVLAPNQPAFCVRKTTSQALTQAADAILDYTSADSNVGGHFSSNRFTAPVGGLYQIQFSAMGNSANVGYLRIGIRKNGSTRYGETYVTNVSNAYVSLVTTALVPLSANDYVEATIYPTMSGFTMDNTGTFSGFLVA
jgi:hypothetical protein